ncbi:DUF1294 domain-containing protein [Anaerotruncus massiliensis (ex Liu et al. 2021)]|uniref:DUF1294 domain-containing protein n=2 Tax=Anaerotruncus TaxID=244127 RepID=A0A498CRS7_9FIRM|nr:MULTISPECIES: DUF1294 domain-containing protein [Anaerotruncus]MBC3940032.1 DUF1294 domain-containing protein [Anaerotruncus massiliensis (ex Togo et al. 2019)]RLL06188.1 DUF1294 domain-containing protein [Anaerotruncus massiliensis (ex Liu et al. 2021)]
MGTVLMWALFAVNAVGLAACGLDKWKAKRGAWRIPEKTLFFFAVIGGGWGVWAGMYLFRHKTRRWYFVVGIPAITLAEYGLLAWALLVR